MSSPWWRHQMETFPALLTLCAGNSPMTGELPAQRSVTRSFDVFFDLHLNKRLSKQSQAGDLRRNGTHYDITVMAPHTLYPWRRLDLLAPPPPTTRSVEVSRDHSSSHCMLSPGCNIWNMDVRTAWRYHIWVSLVEIERITLICSNIHMKLWFVITHSCPNFNGGFNSSPHWQNGHHFAYDIFRWAFVNEEFCILIKISLKFVLKGSIDNIPALV